MDSGSSSQPSLSQQEVTKPTDVVAQASRPLSYTRETDLQLAKWVQDQQALGTKVTFASLRAHAKKLICNENPSFNASIGWVTPFLLRHNLDLNLNKKKPSKTPATEVIPNPTSLLNPPVKPIEVNLQNAEGLIPDLLATALATSLVEHVSQQQQSLTEQARLVLAQSGLTLVHTPQPALATTPSNKAIIADAKKSSGKKDKSQRNRHTLAEKIEVVRLMKENNVAAHYVCRTLGIANSTFAGWTKLVSQKGPELEILSSDRKRANVRGQGRPLSYSRDTDKIIADWVLKQQQLGAQITPAELGKYATSLIIPESPHFTASSGWQQKFLQRHNIQLLSTWAHKALLPPTITVVVEDKLSADGDQTSIPAPIQTEEVVANDFKPTLVNEAPAAAEWSFGSETDSELAQWVKDQVTELGSFAVGPVCKKAEEMVNNAEFKVQLLCVCVCV